MKMKNSIGCLNPIERQTKHISLKYTEDAAESSQIRKFKNQQLIFEFAVISIILVIFGLVFLFQNPSIQYFTCDDTDIFHPFKTDTVILVPI